VNRQAFDELKRHISLIDYLQAHDWQPARPLSRDQASWWIPTKTSFIAAAVAAAGM
jgi:hypothetical protein